MGNCYFDKELRIVLRASTFNFNVTAFEESLQ